MTVRTVLLLLTLHICAIVYQLVQPTPKPTTKLKLSYTLTQVSK